MGSICTQKQLNETQIMQQSYSNKKIQNVTLRLGKVTKRVAINIYQLRSMFSYERKQWQILNRKIYDVIDLQNKKKIPLQIKRGRIIQNQLNDPYYFPSLRSFYVGEWVYDQKFQENVPGGLGRVYENDCIAEGCFKTFQKPIQIKYAQLQLDLAQVIRQLTEQQVYNNINQQLIQDDSLQIVVLLDGIGRIYNRQQQVSGNFVKGKLNGKGKLQINKKGQSYVYEGDWKQGKKWGKGKQKTKLTQYDGYFFKDIKVGKGIQTFYGSHKRQAERLQADQIFQKKLKQDGMQMKQITKKDFLVKSMREQKILHTLRRYAWKRVFSDVSIFENQAFFFQRKYKKFYLQQYVGQFQNNKIHGKGIYVWNDGRTYNGQWKNGKMDGKGQFYWSNGSIYRGQYQNDLRHGQGIMIWKQQARYRGFWAFGVRHGYGQAIQINQQNLLLTGAYWQRDKLKRKVFSKNILLQNFLTINIHNIDVKQEKKDNGKQ